MSVLGKRAKKSQKNIRKKLAEAEKGSTFAPATAKTFTAILTEANQKEKRDFRKKKIEKALQDWEKRFTFAPRKRGKFIGRLAGKTKT